METSEELLAYNLNTTENTIKYYRNNMIVTPKQALESMIAFAKLHVEAALKEASKKAEAKNGPGEWSYLYVDENSIINSYPLTNII